jgi:hypothetical protein
MEFDVTMFQTFLDCERTIEIQHSARDDNETAEIDEQMDTSSSHIGEDEANDLLQSILQYQAKFLICHVETKKNDKQTTKKMIINNTMVQLCHQKLNFSIYKK